MQTIIISYKFAIDSIFFGDPLSLTNYFDFKEVKLYVISGTSFFYITIEFSIINSKRYEDENSQMQIQLGQFFLKHLAEN